MVPENVLFSVVDFTPSEIVGANEHVKRKLQ
jgi:hypothetical protein